MSARAHGLRIAPLTPVNPDRLGAYRAMADSCSMLVYSEPPRREAGPLAKAWAWIKAWFDCDPQHPVMA